MGGRERQPALAARFVEVAPTAGPLAVQMNCEVSAALGTRLGLASAAIAALDEIHERWDGLELPSGIEGDALSLPVRVVQVAGQAVLACAAGGVAAAQAEVRRRAGGHLDPELCRRFLEHAEEVLEPLSAADMLAAVAEAEPRPAATLPADTSTVSVSPLRRSRTSRARIWSATRRASPTSPAPRPVCSGWMNHRAVAADGRPRA